MTQAVGTRPANCKPTAIHGHLIAQVRAITQAEQKFNKNAQGVLEVCLEIDVF